MNGSSFLEQRWDRVLLIVTILLVVFSIGVMINNLYKTVKRVGLAADKIELKPVTPPVSHIKYENLIKGFKESYTPLGVHKRNIFSQAFAGTDQPAVPESELRFKNIKERLRITKIYKKPVKLLFKGYIQLGDGTYVATINWGGKTDFKKVGDTIRGYKVVDFKKDISERETKWGGTEKVDKSIVTLQRDTGERFNLEIGKITLEKEIYAEIWDRKETRNYDVYVGGEILGNKVLDISPNEVIIITSKEEKIYLKKEI